jgi:hypothetical protein
MSVERYSDYKCIAESSGALRERTAAELMDLRFCEFLIPEAFTVVKCKERKGV